MANNFKLFDEGKGNMLTDPEYESNTQRLNGVQSGIASSALNNKFAYQVSLVAYAIASIMEQNGIDATDTMAVSAFIQNLSDTFLQKVNDKATQVDAEGGTNDTKWMTALKSYQQLMANKATEGQVIAGTDDSHWVSPAGLKKGVPLNIYKLQFYKKSNNSWYYNDSYTLCILMYGSYLFIIGDIAGYNGGSNDTLKLGVTKVQGNDRSVLAIARFQGNPFNLPIFVSGSTATNTQKFSGYFHGSSSGVSLYFVTDGNYTYIASADYTSDSVSIGKFGISASTTV